MRGGLTYAGRYIDTRTGNEPTYNSEISYFFLGTVRLAWPPPARSHLNSHRIFSAGINQPYAPSPRLHTVPSLYQLKPAFQNLLRPLVRRLFDNGTTANQITLLAGLGSVLVGVAISAFAQHAWLFALVPLWMLLRMALNAIDGMLAREFDQQSALGAYLNELCDVVADCALILPFALIADVSLLLVLLVTLLAVFSEYAGVLGPMIGASRRYDGPMGKSDRALVLGLLAMVIALGWASAPWINGVFALIAVLLACTLVNRVRQGLKEVQENAPSA